ncbi:MAG TPA: 7TM diverse intracellular signaling domain-containing protein [Candidatus Baltobacteraceae bacterium]|nr:7TM diverse intracellular signaling domain-containing protein [Candidatus Baltobacteraceae bacterium]
MVFLWVALAPRAAAAAPTLVLGPDTSYLALTPYTDAFEERGSSLGISDVVARSFGPPGKLFTDAKITYWLRFRYRTPRWRHFYLFLGYKPSHVDLYVAQPDGSFWHQRSGADIPYAQRPTRDYGVIEFRLPEATRVTTAFVRIQSDEPSTALSIESERVLVTANAVVIAMAGALCAILLMLLLMNLVLVVMLRRAVYIYYAIYILCQLLYRLNDSGIAGGLLWPGAAFSWARGDVFFDGITVLAATLFLRAFLKLRRVSPLLDRINLAVAGIGLAYAIAALVGFPIRPTLAWNFAFFYVPLWIVTIAYCRRQGQVQAFILLVAWSAFMLGSLLLDLKNLGFGPENLIARFFFSYGPYFGLMLECMLITMLLSFDARREYSLILEKQVEERTCQLDAALRTANAANKDLETFSYAVSHDLRAPLRAISGFAHTLAEDYADKLEGAGVRYIERITAGVARMSEMIEALLGLAGVTRSPLHPERVDLSAMASDVLEELMVAYPNRQVDLVVASGVSAVGDSSLLRNLLQNLLGNALKFTSKRQDARVEFGTTERGGETAYFVRDNGAGFDMAQAAKLFGAFSRLHGADEFQGTGIGLATCQRIVHRHHGEIWAEAEVGKGASFYFTLRSASSGADADV